MRKDVIISSIENGGLAAPHFESIVKSIKCTWVKRLLEASECKIALLKNFVKYKDMNLKDIIKCKLDPQYVTFRSKFYEQIFTSWFEIYSRTSPIHCMFEKLWDNKFVIVDNKPVHYQTWIDKGIVYLKDIVDTTGKAISKQMLEDKYDFKIKQMDYNSLISAIPAQWRSATLNNCNHPINTQDTQLLLGDKQVKLSELYCKQFTNFFLSNLYSEPACQTKWMKYMEVDKNDWACFYQTPYVVTRDTKIQSLQYRILNRFFPCNYILSKWYANESEICNYCADVDLIEHYFFSCKSLKLFWDGLYKWWLNNIGTTIKLKPEYVIFGICNLTNDDFLHTVNYCILLAKAYIFDCRKKEIEPNLLEYLRYLKCKLEVEIMLYKIEGIDEKIWNKWLYLYEML